MAKANSVPRRRGAVPMERLIQRDWNAFKSMGQAYRQARAAGSTFLGAGYQAVSDFLTAADIASGDRYRKLAGGATGRMVRAARWRRGIGVALGGIAAVGIGNRLLDWASGRRRY